MKKAALTAFFGLIVLIGAYFVLRGIILGKVLDKASARLKEQGIKSTFHNASFKGFSTVSIDSIVFRKENKMYMQLTSVNVTPNLLSTIFGNFSVAEFSADSISGFYVKADTVRDSASINQDEKQEELARKYFDLLNSSASVFLKYTQKIPDAIHVRTLDFRLLLPDDTFRLNLENMQRKSEEFSFSYADNVNKFKVDLLIENSSDELKTEGKIVSDRKIVFSTGEDHLSFVRPRFSFSIKRVDELFRVNYRFSDSQCTMYHQKVARDTVVFPVLKSIGKLDIGKNYIQLDEAALTIDKLILNIFTEVKVDTFLRGVVKLGIAEMDAGVFFSSLPQGMFDKCRQVKAKGTISFDAVVSYNSAFPDSSIVDGELKQNNLVLDLGSVSWITRVNGAFRHEAIGKQGVERVLNIDTLSPAYVRLSQIPPSLLNAVLINEDPSFFHHRGFITEALRQSLVENMKNGRFKRGGSTLSMQLVKNLYLDRNKNVSRKIEEMLIVWLIENKRLLSKEKMMELYFNIIEFGPGVYGISEASYFYFGKHPSKLSKNESFFIANIIPRPKAFKWAFNEDGTFKEWMKEKSRLLNHLMVRRNMVPAADSVNFNPDVVLTGPASKLVIKGDTAAPADTLDFED